MRAHDTVRLSSAILACILGLCRFLPSARAQTAAVPQATTPAPSPDNAWLLIMLLGIAVVGLVAVLAKAIDLKHKREDEAVQLQAQISDALLRDRTLASLLVTATVHIPLWRRSPATVEMHGRVPTGEFRQAVLHVADQEAARRLAAYEIQDRLSIVPSVSARAA